MAWVLPYPTKESSMKLPPFDYFVDYFAPTSDDEVRDLLNLTPGFLPEPRPREGAPALAAIEWVGHPHIRNRGTIGGSLAHTDPAAELPASAVALDATFSAPAEFGSDIEPPANVRASSALLIPSMLQPTRCARL
jgi:hypothetical protein